MMLFPMLIFLGKSYLNITLNKLFSVVLIFRSDILETYLVKISQFVSFLFSLDFY